MMPPLVVHLLHRLDYGGMENLLVERINRMPAARYRHTIVCLTGHSKFAARIRQPDVALYALDKPAGLALATHLVLWRLLRTLRPAIVHTYNLSAIEYAPVAWLAGVPVRINGLHGRSAQDPAGSNRKHNLLRRLMTPFYDHCYANSADMLAWNRQVIRVPAAKSRLLPNGVDSLRFRPAGPADPPGPLARHFGAGCIVIGSVGRIEAVKDHRTLLCAFQHLCARRPDLTPWLRLAIIGEGPLLPALRRQVLDDALEHLVWLPGKRDDVADILRELTIFALPSIAEGTPGALLEAMACALAVVATAVGGVAQVVTDGVTGTLVNAGDAAAISEALEHYADHPAQRAEHGKAARAHVVQSHDMQAMVASYQALYDQLCQRKLKLGSEEKPCVE